MAKVEVYLENRPDDSDIRIPGLGVFKNNTTTEVDEKVWRRFKASNPDYSDDHTFSYGYRTEPPAPPSPPQPPTAFGTREETE